MSSTASGSPIRRLAAASTFTTATSYFAENGTYNTTASALGYSPAGSPKYTFNYNGGTLNSVAAGLICTGDTTVLASLASATGFTASAKGNVDGDTSCDEWTINDVRALVNNANDVAS